MPPPMSAAKILWNSLYLLPLVVVLAVVAAGAVVWLYPGQLKKVRHPWRIVLPGLRLTGVLVLAASLLQPVIERLRRADERGAVLILIDRSKSMSVTDLSRTPAQLVELADGLGELPPGARARETAGLASQLERLRERVEDISSAANDVETAEAFGRGIEAAHARLTAAQSAFADAARELLERAPSLPETGDVRARAIALNMPPVGAAGGPTRLAWVADARSRIAAADAAVTKFQSEADAKLYETNPQVKAACDELAKRSRWSLAERALLRSETGIVPQIVGEMPLLAYATADTTRLLADFAREPVLASVPDGLASDVAGAVANALSHAKDTPVRAVVLLSDGRQVGGEDALAEGIAPMGVPVFTVAVAPPQAPRDVGFARGLSVPADAFVGETVTIRAPVTSTALPPGATAADVQLKAGEVVQSQRVELRPDAPAQAEFSLRLEHGGPQRIVLSIPPTSGEITAENNTAERWIKVLPERMKVAAFAATAGWDFQLLRGVLSRTPWVRLDAGTLDPVSPKVSLSPEQILLLDVIILSDVPAGALDDVQWDAVNRFVRERGGSLFLLAGPDHLPATYTPDTIVASALLPYDVRNVTPTWREWPGEQGAFRLIPAPNLSEEQLDALKVGPAAGSVRHWQTLGGAFRFIPVPELEPRDAAHALLVEADSRAPVLVESFPRNGRVFFVGTNETWRWRHKVGERDHERFWLQLIRYAAGEPYAVQRDLLALDVDKVAIAPGDVVAVRARILRPDAHGYRVHVVRDGAVVQEQSLSPVGSAAAGRFSATVSGLGEGDYLVRLVNPTSQLDPAGVVPTIETSLHVAADSEAEMADVSGDASLLRRIADASGGKFLPIERARELPALLAATGAERSRFTQVPLWSSPLVFLFVVACFGAEWALRKRVGLA